MKTSLKQFAYLHLRKHGLTPKHKPTKQKGNKMKNSNLFALPNTRLTKVIYVRDGTRYEKILTTPQAKTFDSLIVALLPSKIGASMIKAVLPVEELNPPDNGFARSIQNSLDRAKVQLI